MIRKTLLTLGLTAGLVAAGTGAASAHECYIANRSAQGNAGASHSQNWHTAHVEDLFRQAHHIFGERALTDAEVTTALEMADAQGIPLSVTLFAKHTIPVSTDESGEPSEKSSDGKGIDHFFAAYGDALAGIYFSLVGA